jgi:hypothetical protein
MTAPVGAAPRIAASGAVAVPPPTTDLRSVPDRWHGAAGPFLVEEERTFARAVVGVAEETA